MGNIFENCDVIYSYTRQQAIEDGVLADLTALYPELCKQIYRFPVAVTAEVWGIVEHAVSDKRNCNDYKGVIWDILWMSQRGITKRIDESQHLFQVIISGAGPEQLHTLKIICHPGDNAEPVLTIMMPWED
ncbi:DUF6573 family protein [Geobacter sulfurreducens]|uniref:DUF6573 family protein n=1 Tax=Geobacter sulfurreducens TaxID=35554 RepID=UPI000DBB5B5A|nr:DUF6573 family protein [Geobacter sulfurreducens]BBA70611.1 hypothetical protein YM18_2092 [Geobacter sulfurreducens]